MQLSSNVPYHNEKAKILTKLEEHPEGLSMSELASIIDKKNTTTQILHELLAANLVRTNGKKRKAENFLKNKRFPSNSERHFDVQDVFAFEKSTKSLQTSLF